MQNRCNTKKFDHLCERLYKQKPMHSRQWWNVSIVKAYDDGVMDEDSSTTCTEEEDKAAETDVHEDSSVQ